MQVITKAAQLSLVVLTSSPFLVPYHYGNGIDKYFQFNCFCLGPDPEREVIGTRN